MYNNDEYELSFPNANVMRWNTVTRDTKRTDLVNMRVHESNKVKKKEDNENAYGWMNRAYNGAKSTTVNYGKRANCFVSIVESFYTRL